MSRVLYKSEIYVIPVLMGGVSENQADNPLINTERIREILDLYKFPLITGLLGLALLIVAISLLIQYSKYNSSEVVFNTESTSSAGIKVRIDLEGGVESPGVYELDSDSRVSDALIAAGGLSADADRSWVSKNLNRAAKLTDGGKIYIPKVSEVASDSSLSNLSDLSHLGVNTSKTININTASQAELEALSGVGPVTAAKIIAGRPYQTIEELKSKKIVGNSVFEKIKEQISL